MQLFWRVKPRDATFWGCADFENSYAYLCPCPLLDLGRLIRLDQEGQAGGATVAEKRFGFAYNAAGLFTSLARYKDTDGGSGNEGATGSTLYSLWRKQSRASISEVK